MKNDSCYPQFERLWEIIQELKRGGRLSVYEIGRRYEVSRRTVMRDIQFLRERLGLNILHSQEGYYLADGEYVME